MTVVLLLGSFQMLVLAVMCEYLGRLFMEAKRRPLFVVDRVIRGAAIAAESPEHGTFLGAVPRPDDRRPLSPQPAPAAGRR